MKDLELCEKFGNTLTSELNPEQLRGYAVNSVKGWTEAIIRAMAAESAVERLRKALNLACQEVVETDEGNCPGCSKNMSPNVCPVPREKYKDCWCKYFQLKAEGVWKP